MDKYIFELEAKKIAGAIDIKDERLAQTIEHLSKIAENGNMSFRTVNCIVDAFLELEKLRNELYLWETAEEDKRLVMLPCKIGDTIWDELGPRAQIVEAFEIGEDYEARPGHYICGEGLYSYTKIPGQFNSYHFTYEDAEKEMQMDNLTFLTAEQLAEREGKPVYNYDAQIWQVVSYVAIVPSELVLVGTTDEHEYEFDYANDVAPRFLDSEPN